MTTPIKPGITQTDFENAAHTIGCRVSAIRAVDQVESGGAGFYQDGRLIILFEPHIFWKELKVVGINPEPLRAKFPGILSPIWDKKQYQIGGTSWQKLDRAATIHREAALKSCSWGRYQILGTNHKMVGFQTAQELVNYLNRGEKYQLDVFITYIKKAGLDDELRELDFDGFGRGYNGPLYWKNNYGGNLRKAQQSFAYLDHCCQDCAKGLKCASEK